MSLSTAKASSAPSSSRGEQADVGDLKIHIPSENRKNQPLSAIPPELLLSLTSTVSSRSTQGHTAHHRNCESCGVRRPDAVWHHPLGRSKYKYFLDQPTSLTGAGRDISFLCDAVLTQKKMSLLPPVNEKNSIGDTQNLSVSENVIPREYHIVKNKGIRRLELYEDAFTVQLKDQEHRLRVLPSLRPSGRLEVIQLMRIMDDMLEKAGVDEQSEELTELCQLEGLLELVKTEQDIYNIVFHELIRQVTVGCAERGQLLAKLRQRYQSLLDRIPRRLMALHTEVVAQRALDRRLIEEIYRIKASIQQLNMELSKIKDHDAFVSQEVEQAKQQLTEDLRETHSSSDVVQGYHHLYELHRARLEDQLMQVTEDRDCWSQFTFSLALKVIKAKKLQLVSELQVNEEGWFKTAKHCLLYISIKDTQDLHNIVELTNYWKEQLIALMSQMKKTEHAQFAQVTSMQQGITKWSLFLNTQNNSSDVTRGSDPEYDSATVEEIHADLKQWSHMLALQCEEYQGEEQLLLQQKLNELRCVLEIWLDMSLQLYERHTLPEAESAEGPQTIRELDRVLSELLKQFDIQVSGESGVHRLIMSLLGLVDSWVSKTNTPIEQPEPQMSVSDWIKLKRSLVAWQNLAEEILLHFSIAQTENQKDKNKHDLYSTETTKTLDDVQEFTTSLSNFTESENQKLLEEVTCLHKAQTRWMLDLLLAMVPNQTEEENEDLNHDYAAKCLPKALSEDAKMLSEKLVYFSSIINRSCNLILEEEMTQDPNETKMEYGTNDCQRLQRDCNNWVESCKMLLSGIHGKSEEELIKQPEQPSSSTELITEDPLTEPRHAAENLRDRIEPESTEMTDEEPKTQQERELMDYEKPVLKLIGYDGNITQRNLSRVQLTGTDELVVSPVTEEANRAFSDLTTVVLLQQELSYSEVRARSAEQRALKAEETLHAALEKIQDLERQLQIQTALEPQSEAEAKKTPPPSPPTVTAPASPKSPTGEAKPASPTKKTKKR
ncbi:axonemal dynein light chain domain-containing protein 1 isoform X4 [Girardinichthys multiradiatus]|uniref:axonemal dynein light chain domain-containing protein 1 isoform X4 n=1 Tax=Girardinichthys multiradiatus TaxID=208333 RepID=UPI001FAB3CBD|nr:axonemal dynein light chain domain-containing protein 1 isoform X4 [Girardinichthys multiradiatus]